MGGLLVSVEAAPGATSLVPAVYNPGWCMLYCHRSLSPLAYASTSAFLRLRRYRPPRQAGPEMSRLPGDNGASAGISLDRTGCRWESTKVVRAPGLRRRREALALHHGHLSATDIAVSLCPCGERATGSAVQAARIAQRQPGTQHLVVL